jgi:hypothetical protein
MQQYHLRKKTPFVLCLVFSLLILHQFLAAVSVHSVGGNQEDSAASISGKRARRPDGNAFKQEVSYEAVSEFISRHSFNNRLHSQDDAEAVEKQVRLVYLVPSDKLIQTEYETGIRNAVIHLQAFYQSQMGSGYTFSLHSPIVEVYQTNHPSTFYSSGQNASAIGFFSSVLDDGFALSGGGFDDPNYRWIYYIDADPACGQLIGALNGVALNAANDLRGFTGQLNVPACMEDIPETAGLCRWVGGLGHELGHTFGLPHPPGCDQGTCSNFAFSSLMYLGYIPYPDTYLLQEDKTQLLATGFFSIHNPYTLSSDCTVGPTFNLCLQDESSGNILRVNSDTGEYSFTDCRTGFTLNGKASMKVNACMIHLQDKKSGQGKADRKINVIVHTCSNKANGVIHSFTANRTFIINDSNTLNNMCSCS